ncbi:MAG TPA: DUF1877 family protein [Pyrinomonadaceae bacterium]|nr:DUF1877 family protein [Pyrinomonadaceae bacterium]
MGVETNAYSIPPKMMRKIKNNNDNLAYVLGYEEKPDWKFDEMDFGKRFEENIVILREAGHGKIHDTLDLEEIVYSEDERKFIDYDGYEICIISPSNVKKVSREFENVKFGKLKANSIAKEITDYYGQIIREYEYDYYISNLKQMKKFFANAAEKGNYIIFATA